MWLLCVVKHHISNSPPVLQVNLSCNFFKGTFDIPRYIRLVDSYWEMLDSSERLESGDTSRTSTATEPPPAFSTVPDSKNK